MPPSSSGEDENKSLNSDMMDPRTNMVFPEVRSSAKIVSPPASPVLSSTTILKFPTELSFGIPFGDDPMVDSEPSEQPSSLHTGDEVFFEGLKFIYLDHLDLDDVVNDITVTNVEFV